MDWTRRILRCAVLRESPGEDVLAPRAHTLCRFGNWFASQRAHFDAVDAAAAQRAADVHREMHDSIRSICTDIVSGRAGQAEALLGFEQSQSELLRVLDFRPATEDVLHPAVQREGVGLDYRTTADEFAVSVLALDGEHLGHQVDSPRGHDGPQILLCTEGAVEVIAKSATVLLERGSAAWVCADDGPIRLVAEVTAKLFRATVGI